MKSMFKGTLPVWLCQLIWAAIFVIELAWCFVRFKDAGL